MKRSTPTLSHQPSKGIDGEKYDSLAGLIEPCAEGQFVVLPDGLRERVSNAFSPHSWDELTPFQRRSLARQYDAQHDPALKIDRDAEAHIGYYRPNHVQAWLMMGAVSPQNAALVFFGENPSKYKDSLPCMGQAFDLMKWSFEDAARDGLARNLRDWVSVARARNLQGVCIDGWEACIAVAARDAQTQTDTQPQAAPVEAVGASVAPSKQRRQEQRILELLKAHGYAPLALPKKEAGTRGAKAGIKKLALLEVSLFSDKSFDKAWERLRGYGDVADC